MGTADNLTDRNSPVVNSALWAAAGDALGWITEMRDESGVEKRAGVSRVAEPVSWDRVIGGRFGVKVKLPAGTYSDDTQLRLSVCRSIRGNGIFDAEAFAKIELTVWPSYSLGAGRGTKAAAAHLARRDVNWFSNFFKIRDQDYLHAGGNGAAMRIQPHIWASEPGRKRTYLVDVVRNSLITHGHPHGFCGAVFHALTLAATRALGRAPSIDDWTRCVESFLDVDPAINEDRQLAAFWRPAWEDGTGVALRSALQGMRDEALRDLELISSAVASDEPKRYVEILDKIGCFSPNFRGSGWKTSLAAAALFWLYRNESIADALVCAANALGSDTDTIASMTGALFGLLTSSSPSWSIQDRDYIKAEATRLERIGAGAAQDSFSYPEPAAWTTPNSQSDSVVRYQNGLALIGLGPAIPEGEEYSSREGTWQWLRLSFGQTVLAKRRRKLKDDASPSLLPSERRAPRQTTGAVANGRNEQRSLPLSYGNIPVDNTQNGNNPEDKGSTQRDVNDDSTLDRMTDLVIRSNFDDKIIGRLLNRYIDESGSIEGPVAFAAVIAKAKLARQKRR